MQIDGSHRWWFENRGPKCALLVYIDDATGKLLHLRFAGSENTFDDLIDSSSVRMVIILAITHISSQPRCPVST